MRLIRKVAEMQAQSRAWKADGHPVHLVPTMGALHDGHVSLVRQAARPGADGSAPKVVVSIFVNPLQFGAGEDLERYPRSLESDMSLVQAAGADAVFNPPVEQMYPPGFDTRVTAGLVAGPLEGEARPGHFDGVATVVARLLNAVSAARAVFGQKDAQQLAVIQRMVRDLAIPVEIIGAPTVREQDGLAMSSRNRYLGGADRRQAVALVRALAEAQAQRHYGESDLRRLEGAMRRVLEEHGIKPDYARVVDPESFESPRPGRPWLAVLAARVGSARLIDNASLAITDLLAYRQVTHPAPGVAV